VTKVKVADIRVVHENPPRGNPYRGESLVGARRLLAIEAFRIFGAAVGFEFWYAPPGGIAKRITNADVEWEGFEL
jgi:hypothetical protein